MKTRVSNIFELQGDNLFEVRGMKMNSGYIKKGPLIVATEDKERRIKGKRIESD